MPPARGVKKARTTWYHAGVPSPARGGSPAQPLWPSVQQRGQQPEWGPWSSPWPVLVAPTLPTPSCHLQEPLTNGRCYTCHCLSTGHLLCHCSVVSGSTQLPGFSSASLPPQHPLSDTSTHLPEHQASTIAPSTELQPTDLDISHCLITSHPNPTV